MGSEAGLKCLNDRVNDFEAAEDLRRDAGVEARRAEDRLESRSVRPNIPDSRRREEEEDEEEKDD